MPPIVPDYCEVLTGWRAWNISVDLEPAVLYPISSNTNAWKPLEAPAAECDNGEDSPDLTRCPECSALVHVAPMTGCACGYWSFKTKAHLEISGFRSAKVFGQVSIWGKVIEHKDGYRSQFAYPSVLYADDVTATRLLRFGVPVRPLSEGPQFAPPPPPLARKYLYSFDFSSMFERFGGDHEPVKPEHEKFLDHETLVVQPTSDDFVKYGGAPLFDTPNGRSLISEAMRILRKDQARHRPIVSSRYLSGITS